MRIATAVLIVLAGSTAYAQQLERPPFFSPRPERSLRPLFPVAPFKLPIAPSVPPPPAPQPVPQLRSGPVCLKAVPVDASIDRPFVHAVPPNGLTMRRIEVPPCVTPAPQQPR